MSLSPEQIQAVIEWMNTWEQLKDTAIPMRFKEDFLHKTDDERLCERLRREKIGEELKLISDKMDKKSKQELLQNPLVKEIAKDYSAYVLKGIMEFKDPKNGSYFDDFVKSNEPVREWEILSIETDYHRMDVENGMVKVASWASRPVEELVKNGYEIKKVRRLSDGEIFAVSDNTHVGEITSFEIQGQNMIAKGSDFEYHINQLEKARTVLFVTDDHINIYEGDVVYVVFDDWHIEDFGANNIWTENKTFSTLEKAAEYITLNKPCLSVQDIIGINSSFKLKAFPSNDAELIIHKRQLLELAKSKQNNS